MEAGSAKVDDIARTGSEASDCESTISEVGSTPSFNDGPADLLDRPATRGKFHRRALIFKDPVLEAEFVRKWDNQNVKPATIFLSVCCGLYLTLLALFRLDTQDAMKDHLRCASVIGFVIAFVGLILLRMRWLLCETVTLACTILISANVFTNTQYYLSKMFQYPGDFEMDFLWDESILILALMMLNNSVQAMKFRSSRCWVLPVIQFSMLVFCWAVSPRPWDVVLFMSLMYATAVYFPWRGRRKEECRARSDYLEMRELRIQVIEERSSNRIQLQRLRDIEDRVKAMDMWAGGPQLEPAGGRTSVVRRVTKPPQEPLPCEDLMVPRPTRCTDRGFARPAPAVAQAASPNQLLRQNMAGRRADAALIRKMAERIDAPDYGIQEFFEDSIAAFPELELFFVLAEGSPPQEAFTAAASVSTRMAQRTMGEMEYQRTICALFSVYWLLRLDTDGKESFCLGLTGDWKVRERLRTCAMPSSSSTKKVPDSIKRERFLESADWPRIREMVNSSVGGGDTPLDVARVEAILCLTAFHDVFKMQWLCPQVAEAHAPYKGYAAGVVIQDHDMALSYVIEHYPELLPSYNILPSRMQKLVLFTQSKMQFNHGWFVQAEAPPGLMLSSLKGCLAAAQPGDLPFYFFHWLTDLSGAEGTPKGGAEKFVLRFPEPVLASFLRSIPYLEHLAGMTETRVTEQYLAARWQSSFPNVILPTGQSSIALLRLTVMAQNEAGAVAEAFRKLPLSARELLSEELALTGCHDQYFESCPMRGGPALLIYYGPALLQRCRGVEEMLMALQILAAVCDAGRALWPRTAEEQGNTVLINIGQLRLHDVQGIMGSAPSTQRSIWIMLPKNQREAVLELVPAGDANQLNRSGAQYWVLDLRLEEQDPLGAQYQYV